MSKSLTAHLLLFLLTLFLALSVYSRYFANLTFGDEYDNFTYSWLTKNGILPYRDFFTHHYPSLIFIGLPLEFIGHSQTIYRWLVLILTFTFFTFFYFYLKGIFKYIILAFMLFSSFAISMYSGQQFADGTFWSLFILGAFFIIVSKNGEPLNRAEVFLISVFLWLTIFSSPIHVLPFILLFGFHLFNQKREIGENMRKNIANLVDLGIFLAAPTAIFLAYLLATNSFWDFYFDTIKFNNQVFYLRVYQPLIGFRIFDFYLHTTLDVLNHFLQLVQREGSALLIFVKAAKFLFWPFAINNYSDYSRVIFTDLYNNFFSFEIFIALFYLLGIIALFLKKQVKLAIFSAIFIFGLRMRLLERIHMAPYYLFSYWMISTALVIFFANVLRKRYLLPSAAGLVLTVTILSLFVMKNWYEFGQIAFNIQGKNNQETIDFLTINYKDSEKILVVADESASYYYESQRLPYSRFVNYFEWYDWSSKLRQEWLGNLETYNGGFLIVERKRWEAYCFSNRPLEKWLEPTFDKIRENFIGWHQTQKTSIFVKRKPHEKETFCPKT